MLLVILTIPTIVVTTTATYVEKRAHSFHTGIVPQDCMECICQVESGCKPIGCRFDVNSDSCGYFQIKEPYWIDCGRLGEDWHTCANDLECSSHCVQNYIQKYIGHSGCAHTCQSYARIHNGGPAGCSHTNIVPYWHSVPNIPGCH